MRKIFSTALVVFLLALPAVHAAELLHKGRPIRLWLAELLDDDKEKRIRAESELQKMGTNALPSMLDYAIAPENPFGGDINSSIVYRSFQLMGVKAKPAIPQLITLLQAQDSRSDAANALILIGDEATSLLLTVLTNKDPKVRENALIILRATLRPLGDVKSISPKAEIALPSIEKCINDPDPEVSINAMMTLSAICSNTGRVAKEVAPNLESEHARVRSFAAFILQLCGRQGKPAIPALKKALLDKDDDVRKNAALALHAIDPEEAKKAGAKVPRYE